jgi:hypothetical protein
MLKFNKLSPILFSPFHVEFRMTKKTSLLLAVLFLLGVCTATVKAAGSPIAKADKIIWVGLDYSIVQMVGASEFDKPDVFPRMFSTWNDLFLDEVLGKLEEKLDKTVRADISGVAALNKKVNDGQIVRHSGGKLRASLTDKQISAQLKRYSLSSKSGVGLVFIIESMQKPTACIDVVYFDIATREPLDIQDDCYKAGGFGFRNFWFSPIKRAVKKMD